MAVAHAHTVLHWQENLFDEDMPPEWMWPLVDELDDHFEAVMARRKERYGGSGNTELEDAPDMVQNELTKGKRR